MVNVYLNIEDRQILALSIPLSNIERLYIRPIKWLRLVTFTIRGVCGDLSATPNAPRSTMTVPLLLLKITTTLLRVTFTDLKRVIIFMPGDYHLIDHNALNDGITSSDCTACPSRFRADVIARDGPVCVFTETCADKCNAVHNTFQSQRRRGIFHHSTPCRCLTTTKSPSSILL